MASAAGGQPHASCLDFECDNEHCLAAWFGFNQDCDSDCSYREFHHNEAGLFSDQCPPRRALQTATVTSCVTVAELLMQGSLWIQSSWPRCEHIAADALEKKHGATRLRTLSRMRCGTFKSVKIHTDSTDIDTASRTTPHPHLRKAACLLEQQWSPASA